MARMSMPALVAAFVLVTSVSTLPGSGAAARAQEDVPVFEEVHFTIDVGQDGYRIELDARLAG